jgi:hypothetical protein
MKALPRVFSMTILLGFGALLGGSLTTSMVRASPCEVAPPLLPPDLVSQASKARPYPAFCAIPPTPTDVRTSQAFRAAVIDTRLAGQQLERLTEPGSFHLSETDSWALHARREASPPPPIASPEPLDTEAFVRAARAKTTPPRKPR